jgi:hypothetical protein
VDGRANDYVDNTGADDDVDHTCDHHFNATAYYDHAGAYTSRGNKMFCCGDVFRQSMV